MYECVSRDVFEAHMQRIDQRLEMSDRLLAERLEKLQALMLKDLAEMKGDFSELKGEVKAMNARLDTIQQQGSWKVGWFGAMFTFCGAAVAVYPLLEKYLLTEWILAGYGVTGFLVLLLSLFRR